MTREFHVLLVDDSPERVGKLRYGTEELGICGFETAKSNQFDYRWTFQSISMPNPEGALLGTVKKLDELGNVFLLVLDVAYYQKKVPFAGLELIYPQLLAYYRTLIHHGDRAALPWAHVFIASVWVAPGASKQSVSTWNAFCKHAERYCVEVKYNDHVFKASAEGGEYQAVKRAVELADAQEAAMRAGACPASCSCVTNGMKADIARVDLLPELGDRLARIYGIP